MFWILTFLVIAAVPYLLISFYLANAEIPVGGIIELIVLFIAQVKLFSLIKEARMMREKSRDLGVGG